MQHLKILFLLLFFIATTNSLKAQEKEHEYIPLLDTNKLWIEAMRMEFGDFLITEYSTGDTVRHNDTLFYEIIEGSTLPRYLREDTIEKKVWYRHDFTYPEKLYYDFSMEVGDSIEGIELVNMLYLDSIVEVNFFGKNRRVFYLHSDWDEAPHGGSKFNPIWIEGIGSLAGLLKIERKPTILIGIGGGTELNCYYHNDEMLYQSETASIYGCYFEIDPDPPYIDCIWTSPDTVALNEQIELVVIVHDQTNLTITGTFTSPNNNEYSVSNFSNVPDYYPEYWYALFSDFNNEPGDWYLSKIHIEDAQNNVTEENYTFENSPTKFYVTNAIGIDEQINKDKFSIYPNPVTNISKLSFENNNKTAEIKIFDATGRLRTHLNFFLSSLTVNAM